MNETRFLSRHQGAIAGYVASGLLLLLSACSDASGTGTQSSALSSSSDADGGITSAEATACLTTYAECVRNGGDVATCRDGLKACLPPPPGRPHDQDGDGGCDHGGGGRPGDGDGDHDGAPPPPPPPGDGGAPPPGGPGPRGHVCLDGLDTCAEGTDPLATCVSAAQICFEASRPDGHRGDGDGPR